MDVDGVVSPVHGRTAWGDDVVAGQVFGPVLVSPTLCKRLDALAEQPHVTALWLTSWPQDLRAAMDPFPGRTWPDLRSEPHDPDLEWWKWAACLRWLDQHRAVRRLAWCDDHLTGRHLLELRAANSASDAPSQSAEVWGISVIRHELARRRITNLLVAPKTDTGITPREMAGLGRFVTEHDERS